MEERSKALNQRKEQFYNNLATVLQEIDLMKRETNRKRSNALKQGKEQFFFKFSSSSTGNRPHET